MFDVRFGSLADILAAAWREDLGGISVNEDTLALDDMKRSAKTSGYLSKKHTIKHLRGEMWFPSPLERRS